LYILIIVYIFNKYLKNASKELTLNSFIC